MSYTLDKNLFFPNTKAIHSLTGKEVAYRLFLAVCIAHFVDIVIHELLIHE